MGCVGVTTMGPALWPFILSFALALPNQGPPAPRTNCIRMTPEKEKQIDIIVEKLGNFLNHLSIEHEHFDIRLIKLSIEQHSEDEVEEKETVLQLSVNDCELSEDELEELDHHKAKQHELERENEAKVQNEKISEKKRNSIDDLEREKEAKEKLNEQNNKSTDELVNNTDATYDYDYDEQPSKNFEVMYLDLDETGEKLDEALGKKRPKLVYVQKDKGQIDYWYVKNLRR